MEKEGGSLVDRPRSIAAGEILSNGMSLTMARSGERFRRLRKAVHPHLQPKAAEAYQTMQRVNAMDFILDVLNDPTNHQKHAQRYVTTKAFHDLFIDMDGTSRYAASVVLQVTYGKSAPTASADPELVRIRRVVEHFQLTVRPGAHLVDRVPLLRHLPGYGKQLYEWHREELGLFRQQLRRVKREVVRNSLFNERISLTISYCTQDQNQAGLSLAKALLENTEEHQLSTDEMSYLAGSLFGAGTDTASHATYLSSRTYSWFRPLSELPLLLWLRRATHWLRRRCMKSSIWLSGQTEVIPNQRGTKALINLPL
jgi:hypothetical protein